MLLQLVEYSFNFCWAKTTFWREVEMADEEMLLSLCALSIVAVIMKRRQKRRKNRKIWTREWLRNRTIFGAYYTLLAELRNLDISSYRNFLGMDVTSFEELLHLVLSKRTWTQVIPTLRSPCWYCHETTWHQTRKNNWFKPFNSRQLVERNRAKFYFRSTMFNNFQHVERQISTYHMIHRQHLLNSGYNICCSTNVEPCIIGFKDDQKMRIEFRHLGKIWATLHWSAVWCDVESSKGFFVGPLNHTLLPALPFCLHSVH